MSEWHPIETAPKDVLLIFKGSHSYEIGLWDGLLYRNPRSESLHITPELWAMIPGAPYHLFPQCAKYVYPTYSVPIGDYPDDKPKN